MKLLHEEQALLLHCVRKEINFISEEVLPVIEEPDKLLHRLSSLTSLTEALSERQVARRKTDL